MKWNATPPLTKITVDWSAFINNADIKSINSLAPGRPSTNFKWIFLCSCNSMISLLHSGKLFSCECHRTPMMICRHWFRYWLGAVRQQAITWIIADPDLHSHMAPLGSNELNLKSRAVAQWRHRITIYCYSRYCNISYQEQVVDWFTVSLHNTDDRQFNCLKGSARNGHRPLKNDMNCRR